MTPLERESARQFGRMAALAFGATSGPRTEIVAAKQQVIALLGSGMFTPNVLTRTDDDLAARRRPASSSAPAPAVRPVPPHGVDHSANGSAWVDTDGLSPADTFRLTLQQFKKPRSW